MIYVCGLNWELRGVIIIESVAWYLYGKGITSSAPTTILGVFIYI